MRFAVVCASGIGDALIFQSASFAIRSKGWEATTFSDHLGSFGPWVHPDFASQPPLAAIQETLFSYDAVFLQHDNSQKSYKIKSLNMPIFTFYGSYHPQKHGILRPKWDYVCDSAKTMVENVSLACRQFFDGSSEGYKLQIPFGLTHRRHKKRIAIHPTASVDEKIWPRHKFLKIAQLLQRQGYEPVFTVSPTEAPSWNSPLFPNLSHLASFVYESGAFLGNDSGTAHLASLLQIPHLVIAGTGLQMPLWQPGWYPGYIISPPAYLMHMKFFRNRWKSLINEINIIKILSSKILSN